MLNRNILYKIREYYWILLPALTIDQDTFLNKIKKKEAGSRRMRGVKKGFVYTRAIFQADGSKLLCIYNQYLDDHLIKYKVMEMAKDLGEPMCADYNVNLKQLINNITHDEIKTGRYKYIGWWLHTFLNGKRIIPIIIDTKLGLYYRMQEYWPEKIPEDNIGVIINNRDELDIEDKFAIRSENTIEFKSYVRMCENCGRVVDFKQALKNPWTSFKNEVSAKNRKIYEREGAFKSTNKLVDIKD